MRTQMVSIKLLFVIVAHYSSFQTEIISYRNNDETHDILDLIQYADSCWLVEIWIEIFSSYMLMATTKLMMNSNKRYRQLMKPIEYDPLDLL
jgi:hypothetical protein